MAAIQVDAATAKERKTTINQFISNCCSQKQRQQSSCVKQKKKKTTIYLSWWLTCSLNEEKQGSGGEV